MAGRLILSSRPLCSKIISNNILPKRCITSSSTECQKENWLNKLLVRKIEPTKESHSRMLSDKEVIYELQTHNVKPGSSEDYLKNYENYVSTLAEKKDMHMSLQGSWTVSVGDQDQCLHLWRYDGGYNSIDNASKIIATDKDLSLLVNERNNHLRQRTNQFLLSFSFWPSSSPRTGSNIYEIRSYYLKPGTMIEWGNNWARAINFRQANNEAFGGYFSQVGRLYNVHHIWCYDSLLGRKISREHNWTHPGWDEVVAYTVPLMREMHARILKPNKFSPAQ